MYGMRGTPASAGPDAFLLFPALLGLEDVFNTVSPPGNKPCSKAKP